MKMISTGLKSFLIITGLCYTLNSYCSYLTNIYCSDSNNNKGFLMNEQNEYELVSGEWAFKEFENSYYIAFFNTFILDGGENKFNQLKEKCKNQYGINYIYIQPSGNRFGIFKIANNKYSRGILEVYFSIKSTSLMNSPLRIKTYSLNNSNNIDGIILEQMLNQIIIK